MLEDPMYQHHKAQFRSWDTTDLMADLVRSAMAGDVVAGPREHARNDEINRRCPKEPPRVPIEAYQAGYRFP